MRRYRRTNRKRHSRKARYTVRNIIPSTMKSIKGFSNKTLRISKNRMKNTRIQFRRTLKSINSKTAKFISSLTK